MLFSFLESFEWKETLHTDFTTLTSLENTVWSPMAAHGKRKYEYWCSDMIEFGNEGLIIKSLQTDIINVLKIFVRKKEFLPPVSKPQKNR